MSSIVSGLVPVAGAIALGWVLRRTGLVPAALWPAITRLSYQALLPALLFVTIAGTGYAGLPVGAFLGALTTAFLAMAGVSFAAAKVARADGPTLTSVFQGGLRINGFVVLALAQAVFSPEGVALVALMFGVMVPLVNVLCVWVLAVHGRSDAAPAPRAVAQRIVTNPLIVGCVAGLMAAALPVPPPEPFMETAALVGRAALPLILLSVGADLDFSAVARAPQLLALCVGLKLVAAPLVFWSCAVPFGAEGAALTALMAIGAAPCAASAYVLAREMGGDAALMGGHVTVSTVLAFAALPFWISLAT